MNQEIIIALSVQTFSVSAVQLALQKAQAEQCSLKMDLVYSNTNLLDRLIMSHRIQNSLDYASSMNIPVSIVQKSDLIHSFKLDCEYHHVLAIYLDPRLNTSYTPFKKRSLVEEVDRELDVPVDLFLSREVASFHQEKKKGFDWDDLLKILISTLIFLLLGLMLSAFGIQEDAVRPLFVLNSVICALLTGSMSWSIVSSVLSLLVYSFIFAEPRFSLYVSSPGYPIAMILIFITSLICGYLSSSLSRETQEAELLTNRTKALLETNQAIQKSIAKKEVEKTTLEQLFYLFGWEAILFSRTPEGHYFRRQIDRHHSLLPQYFPQSERLAVEWTWKHRKKAGNQQSEYPTSPYLFFPVQNKGTVYAVLALYLNGKTISRIEMGMIESILYRAALALENIERADRIASTSLKLSSEQNRATLLRAISHDLRTPITSIVGNATNLVQNADAFDPDTRHEIYRDILDNSSWLASLVENLLSASKMENGQLEVNAQPEMVEDTIREAITRASRQYPNVKIEFHHDQQVLLANMDHKLILQVLHNLIENAIVHNPENEKVTVHTRLSEQEVIVSVSDEGTGIPEQDRNHIFEMFYTGKEIADSTRSMGLGLYLCQSIVEAHQGKIWYQEGSPGGSVFSFSLPTIGFSPL